MWKLLKNFFWVMVYSEVLFSESGELCYCIRVGFSVMRFSFCSVCLVVLLCMVRVVIVICLL